MPACLHTRNIINASPSFVYESTQIFGLMLSVYEGVSGCIVLTATRNCPTLLVEDPGGRFKNNYELLNLRALKISMLYKNHIFQCTGKIFCVEFQRVPLFTKR